MRSLNGWGAIPSARSINLRTMTIPGTDRVIRLNKHVAPLFAAYLSDWHRRMPERLKLNKGPVDSWVYREARNASGFSNHASGTAVDLRYDVLKPDGKRHMTDKEMEILDAILNEYKTRDGHRILANGEWWKKADGMHTELSQDWDRGAKRNTTLKDVQEVQKLLGIDRNGKRK